MKLVSLDLETNGKWREYALQPFRALDETAWITSYAYAYPTGDDGGSDVNGSLFPSVDTLRRFLNTCAKHKVRIVGWNIPFDIAWLIAIGLRKEVFANRWLDGMLLWRHLTISPNYLRVKAYGLKRAVAEFWPSLEGYGDDIDFADISPEGLGALLSYNKQDASYTLTLAYNFLNLMEPPMRRAALIEAACLPMVAESYLTGLKVNTPAAMALDAQLTEDHTVAFVKLKLSGAGVTPEVLASPAQLSKLLYDTWRFTPPKVTPTGQWSTDKEALQILAVNDERAAWVRDYREAFTNQAKFVHSTLASVEYNGDGCTRPQAKIYGTYTGRMTYYSTQGKGKDEVQTGVALHQWKRGKTYRELIAAPDGYELLEFDFAGQEFRWMAVEANDPTMLEMCQPGEDAHSFMGARIHGMEYLELKQRVADPNDNDASQFRYLGKFANLACQYRTSAPTLRRMAAIQYGVKISDGQSSEIHTTYQKTYKQVPSYWRRAIYRAKKNGYAETCAGRRVQLLPGEQWTSDNKWSLESTGINFPIQGAGADQKYLALLVLKDHLPQFDAKFYFELHDGLFVIAPIAKAEGAAIKVRHLLSNLPYQRAWGVTLPIQFPVDAKRGTTWGNLEKVHA